MPYCPSCRAEYRPGFERCAACDEFLVAELAPDYRDPEVMADVLRERELALVTLGPLMSLKSLRAELGQEQVACLIGPPPDAESCGTSRCAPRLGLYVAVQDVGRALELLAGRPAEQIDAADLELVGAGADGGDEAAAGDGCPACGKRIPKESTEECPECGLFLGG
ncbi:MAG: hypothetical protein OEQ13_00600 [Acidobacteriota bacterium]|nr:hypothetical protein [Acidobacteriota bacterium]